MISRQSVTTSAASKPAPRHNQRSAKTSEHSEASKRAQRQNQRSAKTSERSAASQPAQRQNFLLAHFLLIM